MKYLIPGLFGFCIHLLFVLIGQIIESCIITSTCRLENLLPPIVFIWPFFAAGAVTGVVLFRQKIKQLPKVKYYLSFGLGPMLMSFLTIGILTILFLLIFRDTAGGFLFVPILVGVVMSMISIPAWLLVGYYYRSRK